MSRKFLLLLFIATVLMSSIVLGTGGQLTRISQVGDQIVILILCALAWSSNE